MTEAEIVRDLASTLAELYRADVDATGQPMSPDPFHAVQNAIEHYRVDEVLISTFAGETSRWLEEDLIGRVREITEKPVEHLEVGRPAAAVAAAVAEGGGGLMESATVALGHAHEEHHGPPEANQSSRIDRQTLGILLFIVSEVMLFGAFFASYFFLRVVVDPPSWPPEPFELPVAVAGINTAILVSSSFTIHYALESIRRGNHRGLKLGLVLTWLLGATFLFIQINEYVHLGFSARDLGLRLDLLRPHRPARRPRLRRPAAAQLRHDPRLPRPLRPGGEGPPRSRGARHLLALRRRHVDQSSTPPSTSSEAAAASASLDRETFRGSSLSLGGDRRDRRRLGDRADVADQTVGRGAVGAGPGLRRRDSGLCALSGTELTQIGAFVRATRNVPSSRVWHYGGCDGEHGPTTESTAWSTRSTNWVVAWMKGSRSSGAK